MLKKTAITVIMEFLTALNAGDETAALALLHDDPLFLDTDGNSVAGKAACAAFVRRLCAYAERYQMDVHSVAFERNAFLIDGHVDAEGEGYSGRVFARIVMQDGKLRQFQRFHGADSPKLVTSLAPELTTPKAASETVH